ncbi:kinase-like domain-containing protein [Gymnopilus junonius]|uniref:Kinase-like domain-containing protein n=1 Tax=Gymnopilus junonius TaxID=109634 RepID=A0A9P5TSX3_GYMJU|nr:kinase-like domain-containing protein [Gymnopilus junonius]
MVSYPDNTSWTEIAESLQIWLDGIYIKQFSHRIQSEDDFTLTFAESKATLSSSGFSPLNGTVGNLWKASTEISGLHVSAKNIKVRKLDLMAFVNFPQKPKESDYEDEDQDLYYSTRYSTHSGKMKQKAIEEVPSDDENIPSRKRRADGAASVQFRNGAQFPEWVEAEERFTIWVHQKKFTSGQMKEAFKMQFDGSFYAAKAFYTLGDFLGTPSPSENLDYLKEEILHLKMIGHALDEFNKQAKKEKISVIDGPKAGFAWLVDSFLDHEKMHKFSGSDIAGHNHDFAGQTCNAFAHWVLEDSGSEFVPSDTQGIVHTVLLKQNIAGPESLTLFNLMSHSKDKMMGLGDNGIMGIKQFCKQHQCNTICKKFGLGTMKALSQALEDDNGIENSKLNIDNPNNCSREEGGNDDDKVNDNIDEQEVVDKEPEAEGYKMSLRSE